MSTPIPTNNLTGKQATLPAPLVALVAVLSNEAFIDTISNEASSTNEASLKASTNDVGNVIVAQGIEGTCCLFLHVTLLVWIGDGGYLSVEASLSPLHATPSTS